MGQKVNPNGFRVGIIKNWDSRWFAADNAFGDVLVEDYNLRKYLKKALKLKNAKQKSLQQRQEPKLQTFVTTK